MKDHDGLQAVFRIRIGLNTDPDLDPAFEVNKDPDPDSDPVWKAVLRNRNHFLRFRFRLLKSYGSGSSSDY